MGELELIEQIEALLPPPGGRVIRALGDDAAVIRAAGYAVVSVDQMVDGVHFRRDLLSGEEIGHRALAGALSDLAAMAARPGEAFLALGIPDGVSVQEATAVVRGAAGLAELTGTTIAGGDVTRAPALSVGVMVVGWVEEGWGAAGKHGEQGTHHSIEDTTPANEACCYDPE